MNRPFRLRPCEWVVIAYFGLAAVRTAPRAHWTWLAAIAIFAGVGSCALARAETRTGRRALAMARDWLALPFVLIAYWSVDWVRDGVAIHSFQGSWIVLDRFLFRDLGLKAAIEFFGPLLPFALEFCYALLYTLPIAALAVLYAGGKRSRVERFLFVLLLGVFTTDTLMPLFPSTDPRLRFPGEDLPAWMTASRALNLWLLSHFDIRASVFPSGHVTTGLATALGMWLAWPERKRAGLAFFLVACAVALAAVYGRYHYLADALGGA
ncbi:MAG: phosphatase PAP2 family protein, partial [Acidobacteriota bacterium]